MMRHPYSEFADAVRPALAPREPPGLHARWLGANALVIVDADTDTTLLVDPYLSRLPGIVGVSYLRRRVSPDRDRVTAALRQAGLPKADAILMTHAHVDHALDLPVVAAHTGATVYGTASAANVARGGGVAEERVRVTLPERDIRIGPFTVTPVETGHLPFPWPVSRVVGLGTTIDAPLRTPAPVSAFRDGGTLSWVIAHPQKTLLVMGSAHAPAGVLADYPCDVAFLAIGGLEIQRRQYRDTFWRRTVGATGASEIILTHWDNFQRPRDVANPSYLGLARRTLCRLLARNTPNQPRVTLPPWGDRFRL